MIILANPGGWYGSSCRYPGQHLSPIRLSGVGRMVDERNGLLSLRLFIGAPQKPPAPHQSFWLYVRVALDTLAVWSAFVLLPGENHLSGRYGLADFGSLAGRLARCTDQRCLDISA